MDILEFGVLVFVEGGKLENLEKNPSVGEGREAKSMNPGHIGGRQALSPLHFYPCSPCAIPAHIITVLFISLWKGYYKLNMIVFLLFQTFQDEGISNYIVVYLRLLTSAQLQKKADFFENFIEGGRTVQEFRSQVKFTSNNNWYI